MKNKHNIYWKDGYAIVVWGNRWYGSAFIITSLEGWQ